MQLTEAAADVRLLVSSMYGHPAQEEMRLGEAECCGRQVYQTEAMLGDFFTNSRRGPAKGTQCHVGAIYV